MARPGGKDRGLFQKNGTWWIRWTCRYQHEHREKAGSKSLARQLYETRKTDVRHHNFCLSEARAKLKREESSSFDKVSDRYLEWAREHRSPSTTFREVSIRRLSESFGTRQLSSITTVDVERHQRRRQQEGVGPATVNRERSVLSHLFNLSIKWKLVESNPVRDTERFKEDNVRPRPLSVEEERKLFSALPPHYQPIVRFAIHTGLRLSEIRNQRWVDVDMSEGILTVTLPKSRKHERVPLNTTAVTILAEADKSGPLLFPRMPAKMSDLFIKYARRAGLEDVTFHCMRDTFVSRLALTANPSTIMALARHRDFRTTQRYLKLDDTHLRQAVQSLVNDEPTGTVNGTEV